jgi:hypothetical protein
VFNPCQEFGLFEGIDSSGTNAVSHEILARRALPRRAVLFHSCPYPKARARKSRKAVKPIDANARIDRAPSFRFGPNLSRCN